MKVIGLTSTYPASALSEAEAVIASLQQVTVEIASGPQALLIRIEAQAVAESR